MILLTIASLAGTAAPASVSDNVPAGYSCMIGGAVGANGLDVEKLRAAGIISRSR